MLKTKADANGDGRLNFEDLTSLKGKMSGEQFEQLKKLADRNTDGSINFEDVKGLDFGSALDDAKNKLGDLFGKK
jgi:Ca2+-binding EF-hand superfamily protein